MFTQKTTADKIVETMLKSMVDNIIRLDGEELTIEAMKGVGKRSSPYKITEKGIMLLNKLLSTITITKYLFTSKECYQ